MTLTGDLVAAWITKELLRKVMACKYRGGLRDQISAALEDFYTFAAAGKVPEIHTLATTVDIWQQPIIAAIDTGLSNARSEGYNRTVKHIGRIAFGFRNSDNQRRRIRWACTRRTRPSPLITIRYLPADQDLRFVDLDSGFYDAHTNLSRKMLNNA